MSSGLSCRQCGCSEIDTDPSRGDAVCTNCGFVLEESLIVSEVTFEEDGHGGASAVGQFISAESRGGGCLTGGAATFHTGVGKESREITLRNAKKKIIEVAQQLRLNQHCIDVAFNFFKMALHKQLTKGRRNALTIAACIYMTCRIEGTPHLLIDFSDVVQMDVYALGRAYIQISRALFINIPAVDPCMYMLRFAHKFNLGEKTHEVAMTGLRLVQRMKRDWIHLGRRPSGLCGAALLVAARLHNFSRTVQDIIRVVKVHETTLRKRLIEFGETPSSSLTLEEFMTVDLEEEHDPPSFKAARIKDREHLQRLLEEDVSTEMTVIQKKIEEELEKRKRKIQLELEASKTDGSMFRSIEAADTSRFIMESTMDTIKGIVSVTPPPPQELKPKNEQGKEEKEPILETFPPIDIKKEMITKIKSESNVKAEANSNGTSNSPVNTDKGAEAADRKLMPPPAKEAFNIQESGVLALIPTGAEDDDEDDDDGDETGSQADSGEIDLTDLDDDELNGYIMNPIEVERKRVLWEKLNEDYIISQQKKMEKLEQDMKDGKLEKKKKTRRTVKEKGTFQAKTASEAIKIMLMERKMSSKINYDVLKTLGITGDAMAGVGLEITRGEGGDVSEVDGNESDKESSDSLVTVIESGPVVPKRDAKRDRFIKEYPSEEEGVGIGGVPSRKRARPLPIYNSRAKSEAIKKKDELDDNVFEDESPSTKKKSKVEEKKVEAVPDLVVVEESGPVVLVESGPVEYATDEFDTEDEEDQVGTLSARELLTQFRGGESDDADEDYYD